VTERAQFDPRNSRISSLLEDLRQVLETDGAAGDVGFDDKLHGTISSRRRSRRRIPQVRSVTGWLHPLGNPCMANGMQYDCFFCKRGLFVR
jgi:hypothetical protein